MTYVIEVYEDKNQTISKIDSNTKRYVGSILEVISPFSRKIKKQMFLTSDKSEAEIFSTLKFAQLAAIELKQLNRRFAYIIVENEKSVG